VRREGGVCVRNTAMRSPKCGSALEQPAPPPRKSTDKKHGLGLWGWCVAPSLGDDTEAAA
jgi:hypothetical protein